MRTFKDTADRTWTIQMNIGAVKRVRQLLGVNLLEVVEGKLIERLGTDAELLCDVVFCLIKPEADEKGVTDEQWAAAMGGAAIEKATEAFMEELCDFFPQRSRLLRKALEKMRAWQTKAIDVAQIRLESPELEQEIAAALETASGSSGKSQEPLGSTPAP